MQGEDVPRSLQDWARLAGQRVDPKAWDYYRSGADDEVTLRRNREAWAERTLHYRVLVDVAEVDTRLRLLGRDLPSPILVAPTAFQRMAHPHGELATARAAGAAGAPMVLSTLSNTPVEAVRAATRAPLWFQLYVYRDRAATEALVRRVEAAGCEALVLTVDAPVLGNRERDARNRFTLPAGLRIENMLALGGGALLAPPQESGLAAYFASLLDPTLSWEDLGWLVSLTSLPVLVKGIVRPDDAQRAIGVGAAGVIVSNHGGRQLDTAPATAEVLGSVVDAVGGQAVVLVDGGIRRGTDVIKALALGADGVLLGRPVLWGLGGGGEEGVSAVLATLQAELERALALCGCASLAEVERSLLGPA